ncbi:echinoderm microtubule-associated protein-like 3 [Apteryx rowi]|uniref:echinoderm microtubule-associated protein-like 3 n=1 Tax=Apteryx rowi TaxID=308060 RepID=UPI000E1D8AE0|nr:echinoderm microtubule-associated protein-like 3 [Apteryx rowi]
MFLRGRPITMYIPSGVCNYEELRTELPARRLQLDWVYGYRGRDSRSNLYVLASGELVYFIACAVVLYHVAARRQRHYLRHTDCVRCLSVHPDRVRVATGQAAGVDKDGKPLQPVVHIWDSSTLLTLQQIGLGSFERGLLVGTTRNALLRGSLAAGFAPIVQGHTDELWGLATHPSRSLFLTCGHDRQLCVWDSREHALAWSLALEDTGLCADFHPGGHVVAVGLQTGRWLVLDAETRQVLASGADGSGEQLSVVRYSPDGEFLAVGSHDNVIYIYGVGERGRKYSRFGRCAGHSSFITHLDWSKDSRFIMSNSGDYEILYWDVAGGCKLLRNRFESRDREWATYTCVLGFHVFGVWPDGSDGTDINSLCRSHDERVVAVADDFCKVHLFQYPCARAKAPSHVYGGHGSHVTNVRFSHDDVHLVSLGGKDTSIFQWRVLGGPCRRSLSADGTGTDNDGTGDGEEPR